MDCKAVQPVCKPQRYEFFSPRTVGRWVIADYGVNALRVQMHLLEDSTEQEVARMEGTAAGTLYNPGRRHEIENIMVMGSKQLTKDNIWV